MQPNSPQVLHVTASHPPNTLGTLLSRVRWFNLGVVTLTPLFSIYGLYTTKLHKATVAFAFLCYLFNMFGELYETVWLSPRLELIAHVLINFDQG